MAFCDQRGLELKTKLEKYPPLGMTEAERKLILAAVEEWDKRRYEHLDALCKIMLESSGTASARAWQTRVAGLREALRKLSEILGSSSRPQEATLQFVQSNCAADEKFIAAIAAAVVAAEARDYMVNYLEVLRTETKNLETKWSALQSQHTSYQEQEAATVTQVEALIREAVSKARDLDAKMASAVGTSVSTFKDALQRMPEGGADAASIPNNNELVAAGLAVDAFRALKVGIEDQTVRFERYMREETGSVLFLFQDVRKDTQQFIDKFGYRTVLEKEEAAYKALDAIVTAGGTTIGNRHDAEKFVEAARILVKGHVNNAKNTWDDFVIKHEKKFFGPVGPNIARALLDRDLFESKYRNLQADNLNELAARWRNNSRETWGVSFAGIPPNVAETYRNALKTRLRELDELLRDPLLKRFGDSMKVVLDNAGTMIFR